MSSAIDLPALLAAVDAAVEKMTPGEWYAEAVPDPQAPQGVEWVVCHDVPDAGRLPLFEADDQTARKEDARGVALLKSSWPRVREEIARLQYENKRAWEAADAQNVAAQELCQDLRTLRAHLAQLRDVLRPIVERRLIRDTVAHNEVCQALADLKAKGKP